FGGMDTCKNHGGCSPHRYWGIHHMQGNVVRRPCNYTCQQNQHSHPNHKNRYQDQRRLHFGLSLIVTKMAPIKNTAQPTYQESPTKKFDRKRKIFQSTGAGVSTTPMATPLEEKRKQPMKSHSRQVARPPERPAHKTV